MPENSDYSFSWDGESLRVKILYSRAGFSQHILIESDRGALLFDTGDGILRDIITCGLDKDSIEAIFFTHGHFDHMGGLHPLLGFLRMIGRKKELHILAPENCLEVISAVENFLKLYSATTLFEIYLNRARPGEKYEFAGMVIQPFPVIHCGSIEGKGIMDQIPAVGYRISCGDEIVVISGDTGDCESLRDNVRGADFAIIEATFAASEEATDEELKKVHLSEDLASEIGKTAKEYILVHKGCRA
ncbi:MAG: ribonuclease Z [Candidatus Zixiibacteriota bacterium]|nr:MAG: ribonuclease Z [candidate division Zixibacteria bacterium]